jgi:predicted  nucleic acid-binding Zn-ribbon protein
MEELNKGGSAEVKEKTIGCPNIDCGHFNPKNRLTCEECGTRLFSNHKSSEEKAITKKAKKILTKKSKAKKEGKEKVKKGNAKAKPKEKKQEEYPQKGSVKDKLLSVIKKHPDGVAMPGIQKDLKIGYRLDSYTQELEERKLIKSKMNEGERIYLPL